MTTYRMKFGAALALCAAAAALTHYAGAAASTGKGPARRTAPPAGDLYGTDTPFAAEAIYFLMTDRFVDGDPTNNQVDQGKPDFGTFDRDLPGPNGKHDNIGYLGGDFKGVLNNADYIAEMGFTSVWLTPIVDNPDAAFSGSEPVKFGSGYVDGMKTGYHGYWGVNFYKVDEHLPSEGLDFRSLLAGLKRHKLHMVLDIVGNHGSPAYTMRTPQPEFGRLYDESGTLVADHQNLRPEQLDPNNPLHKFYNRTPGLATLSDLNPDNPAVIDYLVGSYLKWIDQGVYALRIDTIKEQPNYFWKKVSDRIRARRPGMFMFGESYSFDPKFIAQHTFPENGGFSVLDFPGRNDITKVFEHPGSDFAQILPYLNLETHVYQNPYDLVTFYDNHDMARMNAADNGYIDANNWLFTARGIPSIYYGSEVNFMRGAVEHQGNRNYFGQERIDAARSNPIRRQLSVIAHVRKANIALQKGLQLNLRFAGDTATFYRIYQKGATHQTALVLLNKGDAAQTIRVDGLINRGIWRDAISGAARTIRADQSTLAETVPAHGVRVLVLDAPLTNPAILGRARALMKNRVR